MPSYNRLLVASSKGGVGKSTTAIGLAAAFASDDFRSDFSPNVLLLDLDVSSRSLDLLAGCEDRALFDIGDVLDDDPTHAAVTNVWGLQRLSLIRACTASKLRSLASERGVSEMTAVRMITEKILTCGAYDIVVCDTGGGLEIAAAVADLFGFTVITSEQSRTSIRSAEYAAHQLSEAGADVMRLVICSFDLFAVKKEKRAGVIEMIDSSSLQCAGVVPFDRKLQSAQDKGTIPDKKSPSQTAYRNIAKRIMGYDVPLFSGIKSVEKKKHLAF